MENRLFARIDPLVDELADQVSEIIAGPHLERIKAQLSKISRDLGEAFSVSLEFNLQIVDDERGQWLPLLKTGLATSNGADPYQAWGDSSPQRYIVNGEMMIVPRDHCPDCWAIWDFKLKNLSCSGCGARMGDRIKLLLDSDRCPNCERGSVSANNPRCDECEFEVNPDYVVWG